MEETWQKASKKSSSWLRAEACKLCLLGNSECLSSRAGNTRRNRADKASALHFNVNHNSTAFS